MSETIYSIYKVKCIINNKIYIGFTENIKRRKQLHLDTSNNTNNKEYKYSFHNALRKHGKENFEWEIIYQSKNKEYTLNIAEDYFIDEYNSMNRNFGYNMTSGGKGGSGIIVSEETRRKISVAAKGRIMKEETKIKLSKALKGRIFSEEHKRKIGEANRRRVVTEETKQKLREYNTGLKQSTETIAKRVAKTKGKVQKPNPQRAINISKRYIITFPDGHEEEIRNMAKFCRENGLNKSSMCDVIKGRKESHKGFKAREIPKN